jgi:hypothetical protein
MTILLSLEGKWLLHGLCQQTPGYLRQQLIEPDPITLHDWNIDREAYVALVRLALTQQGE